MKNKDFCNWCEDDDFYYVTNCGGNFMFGTGSVKDNLFNYCPFCGKEIKVISSYAQKHFPEKIMEFVFGK